MREARQARRLSQEALALETDVTHGAVFMYERGANLPSVETLLPESRSDCWRQSLLSNIGLLYSDSIKLTSA
ncbi:helix-turn-helix transcriptional regulator [Herbaspirillum seropedicae]|uniref:helix-turn-helix transcriptional regulator n=1 Tax=Herbaspirillum seropedicae TaxID=964 RepID=UPI003395D773